MYMHLNKTQVERNSSLISHALYWESKPYIQAKEVCCGCQALKNSLIGSLHGVSSINVNAWHLFILLLQRDFIVFFSRVSSCRSSRFTCCYSSKGLRKLRDLLAGCR